MQILEKKNKTNQNKRRQKNKKKNKTTTTRKVNVTHPRIKMFRENFLEK